MKRDYISPEMIFAHISPEDIITASPIAIESEGDGSKDCFDFPI